MLSVDRSRGVQVTPPRAVFVNIGNRHAKMTSSQAD